MHEWQVFVTGAWIRFIFDLVHSVLVGVLYYYDVYVSSQGCCHCFVLLLQQLTECGLELLNVLLIGGHQEGLVKTGSHSLTTLDILLICVLVVESLEINVEGTLFLSQFFLIKQVVILVLVADGDPRALSDSSAWWGLLLAD